MASTPEGNQVVAVLRDRRDAVLDAWVAEARRSMGARVSEAELRAELTTVYDALVATMGEGTVPAPDDPALAEVRALLAEVSRSRARLGATPSETAVSVLALERAVLGTLDHAAAGEMPDILAFARLVDELGLVTFETYVTTREQIITSQAEDLLELSTPVVKLWDGVVGIPLIGTLDSARTEVVTEKLLQALVDTGSERAIIDITGVATVDTQVAQHLLKTVVAARLMGADCVISGVRPQIAQTIVGLGIEFHDVATKAKLADALKLTLRAAGYDIVPRRDGAGP